MQAHVVPTRDIGEMGEMGEQREQGENYLTSFFPYAPCPMPHSQFPIPYLTSVILRV